jgi:hypothetical protein
MCRFAICNGPGFLDSENTKLSKGRYPAAAHRAANSLGVRKPSAE